MSTVAVELMVDISVLDRHVDCRAIVVNNSTRLLVVHVSKGNARPKALGFPVSRGADFLKEPLRPIDQEQPPEFGVQRDVRPLGTNAVCRDRVMVVVLIACLAGVLPSACSPAIDLKDGLRMESVSTGWASVGGDKVVPALTFTLKNVSDQTLVALWVTLRFRSVDEVDEWGTAFQNVVGSRGLAAGAVTDTLYLRAPHGYVGRGADRMVANFAQAKVEIFARYAANPWTPVGEYRIARQLIDR